MGFSNARRRTVMLPCLPPEAASTSMSDSGVTMMAATATATATETEADRLKREAITGSPAEPTFGPEAVKASSALSCRPALNRRD